MIMSDAGGTRKVEAERESSNNVKLKDTTSKKKTKVEDSSRTSKKKIKRRERESVEEVKVGDRVKAKFDDGVWYNGSVSSVKRGKVGEVVRVMIDYDDDTTEGCKWPDIRI